MSCDFCDDFDIVECTTSPDLLSKWGNLFEDNEMFYVVDQNGVWLNSYNLTIYNLYNNLNAKLKMHVSIKWCLCSIEYVEMLNCVSGYKN